MTHLICITCPKGCRLSVDEENGYKVTGNSCPRGEEYGRNEVQNPVRVVTSTVRTASDEYPRCPVKTNGAIPKGRMFEAMRLLDGVTLQPPIKVGDAVIKDLFGTGIDFVAAKSIEK